MEAVFDPKNFFFSAVNFAQFLVIKTPGSGLDPDPDPDWRIGIQPKMLDPDPYQMNTDPQPCYQLTFFFT